MCMCMSMDMYMCGLKQRAHELALAGASAA